MKTSLVVILFFYFLGFSSSEDSRSDSCSSNLTLSGIPFNATPLKCVSVWSSEDFILRYQQLGPSLWNFILSAPNTNSYVGIGFSPDGKMVGSSSIVGWVPSGSGKGAIKQYSLEGTRPSTCLPDKGDLSIKNMSIVSQSNRLFLAFQLNTTDQPKSKLIYTVGPKNKFPSSSDYLLSEHRSETSTTLNFATGTSSESEEEEEEKGSDSKTQAKSSTKRNTVLLLNVLGWALLVIFT